MTQITIDAQVVNGHLQHEKSLTELEGQHVVAVLTVVPSPHTAVNGSAKATPATPDESAEFDPEPPPWLVVEHDLYFPVKPPTRRMGKVKVRTRRGKPCIILPEELPDE